MPLLIKRDPVNGGHSRVESSRVSDIALYDMTNVSNVLKHNMFRLAFNTEIMFSLLFLIFINQYFRVFFLEYATQLTQALE